jgi:hypothetical protein
MYLEPAAVPVSVINAMDSLMSVTRDCMGASDATLGDVRPDNASAIIALQQADEQPLELAKQYLASGQYLWNSGMFGWKVSTLLENMKTYMPENFIRLTAIREAVGTPEEDAVLKKEFPGMESSIAGNLFFILKCLSL